MAADVRRRVLLALASSAPAAEPLDVALRLAIAMQAELAGVFVEDPELLRVAALPFTHEVGVTSAVVRPLESAEVEGALRRRAEQARQSLASGAARASVHWSFSVTRGSVSEQIRSAAGRADVIVAAERTRASVRSGGAPPRRADRPVTVLVEATAAGQRALAIALSLAQGHAQLLSVLVPAAADLRDLREWLAASRPVAPELPRIVQLQSSEPGGLAREVRRLDSRVLVLSAGGSPELDVQIRLLLEDSACPLVLVP